MNKHGPESGTPAATKEESPDIKKYIRMVLGEGKAYGLRSPLYMKVHLKNVPREYRTAVLESHEIRKLAIDYLTGKNDRTLQSINLIEARLKSVPEEMVPWVLDNAEFRQFLVDKVIGKGEETKFGKIGAQARLDKVPEQIRQDIADSPEVQSAFPGLGKS
jgi:hypothetical protein